MLNMLRKDLERLNGANSFNDLVVESAASNKIRDRFLNDPKLALLGEVDTKETEREIDAIPEFEGYGLTDAELTELESIH